MVIIRQGLCLLYDQWLLYDKEYCLRIEFSTVQHEDPKIKVHLFAIAVCVSVVKAIVRFIRVCAQSKRRLFHACAAEYEKPPADRGDVAKANKVPARRCDRTDEIRHLNDVLQ